MYCGICHQTDCKGAGRAADEASEAPNFIVRALPTNREAAWQPALLATSAPDVLCGTQTLSRNAGQVHTLEHHAAAAAARTMGTTGAPGAVGSVFCRLWSATTCNRMISTTAAATMDRQATQ